MNRSVVIPLALAAVTALGACDKSKEMLGLEKEAPDEFAVYSRAPLSLPPDYSLKPPTPGQERPQDQDPKADARRALLGDRVARSSSSDVSTGLDALYRQTGADKADPTIRTQINRETSIFAEEDKTFTDRIMFLGTPTEYGTVVDPVKESKRIQENQALGNPINQGDVPTMERKRKGLLQGIF